MARLLAKRRSLIAVGLSAARLWTVGRSGAQDPKMTAAADLHALADRLAAR